MNMTVRKGRSGLLETGSFIAQFPLHQDADKATYVTVTQFDDWAVKAGFIPDMVERDTRNSDRNVLRGKINNTASSKAWTNNGAEPFHIGVDKHGTSYRVIRTNDAFTVKAEKLPSQMESLLKTKRSALEYLHSSVDLKTLPLGLQLGVTQLAQEIVDFGDTVGLACTQLNRKFHMIQNGIMRAKLPQSAGGGIAKVMSVDNDTILDDKTGEPIA